MMSCGICDFGVLRSTTTPRKSGTGSDAGGSQTSPLSIIEQWQRDAKGAVEDAYANYVLGDDTGEAARLVLVANPSDDISLLENTGNGRHPPHVLLNDPQTRQSRKKKQQSRKQSTGGGNSVSSPPTNNNLLLFSHLDFYTDANRHNLMGLQRTNNKHDPHVASFRSCGVTFVEINGRAYVHTLDEESAAYRSGVRPRDSVQYAAVLAKEWEDPMGGDFDPISSQALEREDSGQRITYEELKRVFLQGSGILGDLPNASDVYERYEHHQSGHVVMGPPGTHPPPLPTTIRIGKNPCGALLSHRHNDDDSVLSKGLPSSVNGTTSNNGLGEPRPVVLVFRRTKQRPPKAWNVWPNYRLDDECDVACQILESLTMTPALSSPTDADTTHGVHSPPSSPKRRRSRDGSSVMWDDGSTSYTDDPSQYSSKKGSTSKILFSTDDHGGFRDASDETDNVEASTIRGMIAKAVGLAFVRSNKVVFGVSVHGGSGIVLSRLSDGTWSSPSLIGMAGMGLGLQVGLEVANYIFILQTEQALEHFSRGGSFTLGANVGAAFAGMGREAVGAASVSPALCGISQPVQIIKEDEYNYEDDEEDHYEVVLDDSNDPVRWLRRREASCTTACSTGRDRRPQTVAECTSGALEGNGSLAPVVAYAKSEGLYVGVSLEGSRIFARDEANAKAYKYFSYNHKAVTARDILTGKIVSRPPEAESLYALLHDIELTHEYTSLPIIPTAHWLVVPTQRSSEGDWTRPWDANAPAFLSRSETSGPDDEPLAAQPESELDDFAAKFRDLLFGGITVTRISPLKEKRERRTLWLSSPTSVVAGKKNSSFSNQQERNSLKVGFVSKLYSATAQKKHLSTSLIDDFHKSGHHGGDEGANTELGDELTLDSALMDNQSLLTTTGTLQERVKLSKKLSMDLVDVLCLTQMTPQNVRLADSGERDRVICLESSNDTQLVFLGNTIEETRLLYCGLKLLLEQETTRMGIRGGRPSKKQGITSALKSKNRKSASFRKSSSSSASLGYASSDVDDTDDGLYDPSDYYHAAAMTPVIQRYPLPEGWRSWGRVPGRSYMRAQATSTDDGYPTYAHGQLLVRDLCKTVLLPLPLPLCRVLLLDSSSPVVSKWETERGDTDFERTPWTFPPATPREMDQFQSEHQLIASGSMCGAHRTVSYERYRNGRPVRLSETHIVDSDDSEKLAFQVSERLPRRGFSIKAKILLRAVDNGSSCEATVLGEIRPVGKNMSDPAAVHKALLKVLDELRNRYGTDCVGLLAGFANVIENMPKDEALKARTSSGLGAATSSSWRSGWEEKKETDPFSRHGGHRTSATPKKILEKTSVVKFEDVMNAELGISDVQDSRFLAPERRPGASSLNDYKAPKTKKPAAPDSETFGSSSADPVTIEVKPLPKIRLSLMPSPREEDEENLDEEGEPRGKTRSSHKSRSGSGGRKSSRSKRSSFSKKSKKNRKKHAEHGAGR